MRRFLRKTPELIIKSGIIYISLSNQFVYCSADIKNILSSVVKQLHSDFTGKISKNLKNKFKSRK